MKKLLISLLSVIFLCSFTYMKEEITFGSIELSGLKSYQGKNFTLYLNRGAYLGPNKDRIKKVHAILGSGQVTGDIINLKIDKSFSNWGSNFQRPNLVTLVIHSSILHSLNVHRASRGIFAQPDYASGLSSVPQSVTNQMFEQRKSVKLDDVLQTEMINL